MINRVPLTQPHTVVMRAENFLLIFIQPLIDPLLIHSVQSGKRLLCQAADKQATQASGHCGRSASQAASLKCGQWQPHWPSQVVKRQKMCAGIMAKTSQWSYFNTFFFRVRKKVSQPSGKQFYQWGSQTDSWSFSHLSNQSINLSANKLVSHSASQWLHQPGMVRSEKLSPLTVVKDVPSDSVNSSRNMLLCCFICHYGSPPASVGRLLSPFPQERHQKPFLTITCY